MGQMEEMKVKISQLYKYASTHLQKSARIQATAHAKAGYRVRHYQVGQAVWRYYPPWANEKLGSAWTGPWIVRRQYPNSTVQVQLAKEGRGAKSGTLVVLHASCLKPVCTTGDGKLLQCDLGRTWQGPTLRNSENTTRSQ